eukprot:2070870-Pyramimonas_sp.AAC.1
MTPLREKWRRGRVNIRRRRGFRWGGAAWTGEWSEGGRSCCRGNGGEMNGRSEAESERWSE